MLRRFLIGLGVLVGLAVAGAIVMYVSYSNWHAAQVARLEAGSKVANTAKGPVEYALSGSGAHTILFVHGTPGGYDQGVNFAKGAERQGVRVLRVSRPGYLRTPVETGLAPADQADAYAALLDTLGIAKVAILGVSGGGPSSAQFAARHPEHCEALFMLSAVSKSRPRNERRPSVIEAFLRGTDLGGWLLWRGARRNPAGSIKRVISDPASQQIVANDPQRREAFLALSDSSLVLASRRGMGFANDVRWFAEMPEIPLATIRVPTLVIHGDRDKNVEMDHAQNVVDKVPGAELVRVEGGNHFMSLAYPERVFPPVFKRLRDLDTKPGPEALTAQAGNPPAAPAAAAAPPAAAPAPAPPPQ